MYVKTTSRTNKDGTPVRYLHLAHNAWDPAAGRSVPKVLYSFGREDALDRAAVKRLVASLSKLLDPADALAATAHRARTRRRTAATPGTPGQNPPSRRTRRPDPAAWIETRPAA